MMKTEEALAMIGGHVDEELLLCNEYLAVENEILREKFQRWEYLLFLEVNT